MEIKTMTATGKQATRQDQPDQPTNQPATRQGIRQEGRTRQDQAGDQAGRQDQAGLGRGSGRKAGPGRTRQGIRQEGRTQTFGRSFSFPAFGRSNPCGPSVVQAGIGKARIRSATLVSVFGRAIGNRPQPCQTIPKTEPTRSG